MNFETIVIAAQVIVSVLLIGSILLQHRASGLSATFGGSGASYVQRRGAEEVVFRSTIWLSAAFFILTIVQWYI